MFPITRAEPLKQYVSVRLAIVHDNKPEDSCNGPGSHRQPDKQSDALNEM